MNLEQQMVEVYNRFFDDKIETIEIIEKNYESLNDYRKYAFIKMHCGKEVIIKAYKNEYNTPQQVDGYAELSEQFKQSGINVPSFYKSKDNNYLTKYDFNNGTYMIWCEEKLPYKVFEDRLNLGTEFYSIIGKLLGRMHLVSRNNNLNYPWNSALVLFEPFADDVEFDDNYENAKCFYNKLLNYDINKALLNQIWDTYNNKRKEIENAYAKLPYGAVQGDLSLCNILSDEEKNPVAIIDFNQSGNARFINDMMQWAIYFVFSNTDKEFDNNLKNNFIDFFKGYTAHYNFTSEELSCINNLYNIIRPFRHYEQEHFVIKLFEEGNKDEANKYLEWMLYELTRDDIRQIVETSSIQNNFA